ncbi:MAG: RNA polymerase sigma factor [Bacteroidales bacterium]
MSELNEDIIIQDLRTDKYRRAAFEKVVSMYSEKLYWQIRKMVLNHDDANDILQNTFLKAWANLDNFRGDAKLSTWLYRIAINESITFLNSLSKKNGIEVDDPEGLLMDRLESDNFFDGDSVAFKLQKAILTLPEKQRLVFNMRYFDELKYDEISEILGTSVGALKASYHHAAKKIEEYMLREV